MRAYRWSAATGFTMLANYSTGSSGYGYATAVNSNGAVVGAGFEPTSGSIVASMWLSNGSIVRLSPADPNPSVAVSITDQGTVAGWAAIRNNVNHAVIWKSSPQSSPVKQSADVGDSVHLDAQHFLLEKPDFDCVPPVALHVRDQG
jgi:hypothetical protein